MLVLALLTTLLGAPAGPLSAADEPRPPAAPPTFVPDQLLVGFLPQAATAARTSAVEERGGDILSTVESIGVSLVRIPAGRTVAEEAAADLKSGQVRFAEPNFIFEPTAVPNDPDFANQWGFNNTGQVVDGVTGTADVDIDAPEAWEVTTGSRNVVVGVIDSGIDYTHPDLAPNIWHAPPGFNVNGCGEGSVGFRTTGGTQDCNPLDVLGHGTQVAGIIGSAGNNGSGVTGVNWQVSLMAIKICDRYCHTATRSPGSTSPSGPGRRASTCASSTTATAAESLAGTPGAHRPGQRQRHPLRRRGR